MGGEEMVELMSASFLQTESADFAATAERSRFRHAQLARLCANRHYSQASQSSAVSGPERLRRWYQKSHSCETGLKSSFNLCPRLPRQRHSHSDPQTQSLSTHFAVGRRRSSSKCNFPTVSAQAHLEPSPNPEPNGRTKVPISLANSFIRFTLSFFSFASSASSASFASSRLLRLNSDPAPRGSRLPSARFVLGPSPDKPGETARSSTPRHVGFTSSLRRRVWADARFCASPPSEHDSAPRLLVALHLLK
ncbi:unnamed protein product [Protopolystoma xenopodis]|uniref:Uncharacterized protein n=1 Tax=Protopolystoma xenopodis TaxID=117903 RepID=A0A448XS89_9PLAT|nr:unnamed protein product [Protopolystoma xenopodis]